jgi:hypothetical protein
MGMITTDASPSASALAGINGKLPILPPRPYVSKSGRCVFLTGLVQMSQTLPLAIVPAFSTSVFATSIQMEFAHGQLVWIIFFFIGRCPLLD